MSQNVMELNHPLDELASEQYSRYKLGFSTDIVVGVSVKGQITSVNGEEIKNNDNNHDESRIMLETIAQHLLNENRMLSAVVLDDKPKGLRWGGILTPIDVSRLVTIENRQIPSTSTNSARVEDVYDRYLAPCQFDISDKTMPLWKIVLNRDINGDDILLLVISHIIGDGSASQTLLLRTLDLIDSYHTQTLPELDIASNSKHTLKIQTSCRIPLPLQQIFNTRPSIATILHIYVFSFLASTFCPEWFFNFISSLGGHDKVYYSRGNINFDKTVFKSSLETRHRVIYLPLLGTIADKFYLYNSNKRRKPTVNSLLCILLEVALFKTSNHFNTARSKSTTSLPPPCLHFLTNTAMSALKDVEFHDTNDEIYDRNSRLTTYSGACRHDHSLKLDTKFWDAVDTYQIFVNSEKARKQSISTGTVTNYAVGGHDRLLLNIHDHPQNIIRTFAQIILSNIGRLYYDESLKPKSFDVYGPFFNYTAAPFVLPLTFYVTTLDKHSDISLSLSWKPNCVSDEWIEYFEATLWGCIRKLNAGDSNNTNTLFDSNLTVEQLIS